MFSFNKINKIIIAMIVIFMATTISSCFDEEDVDDIANMIESLSAIAFLEVIKKNPDLETVMVNLAEFNIKILDEREIDSVKARQLIQDTLNGMKNISDDDKRIVLEMTMIIIPQLDLPDKGLLNSNQKIFMKAFFRGILNASESKKEINDLGE